MPSCVKIYQNAGFNYAGIKHTGTALETSPGCLVRLRACSRAYERVGRGGYRCQHVPSVPRMEHKHFPTSSIELPTFVNIHPRRSPCQITHPRTHTQTFTRTDTQVREIVTYHGRILLKHLGCKSPIKIKERIRSYHRGDGDGEEGAWGGEKKSQKQDQFKKLKKIAYMHTIRACTPNPLLAPTCTHAHMHGHTYYSQQKAGWK